MTMQIRNLTVPALWTASFISVLGFILWPFWPRGLGVAGIFLAVVAAALTIDWRIQHRLRVELDEHRIRVQAIFAAIEADRITHDGIHRIH